MKTVLVQQFWLALSLLLVWLVLSIPASLLIGRPVVGWLAIAGLLCLAPGCLVLGLQPRWVAAGLAGFGAMFGSVLRMVFVLAGLIVVAVFRPEISLPIFGAALVVFYLVSLLVETLLVVRCLGRERVRLP